MKTPTLDAFTLEPEYLGIPSDYKVVSQCQFDTTNAI